MIIPLAFACGLDCVLNSDNLFFTGWKASYLFLISIGIIVGFVIKAWKFNE